MKPSGCEHCGAGMPACVTDDEHRFIECLACAGSMSPGVLAVCATCRAGLEPAVLKRLDGLALRARRASEICDRLFDRSLGVTLTEAESQRLLNAGWRCGEAWTELDLYVRGLGLSGGEG